MSQFFKNIGLKFFNKQQNIDIVDEEVSEESSNNSEYHIEFIDYKKVSFLKLWCLKKFCMHDWKAYHITNVMGDGDIPIRIDHTLICRKCGKIKKISI